MKKKTKTFDPTPFPWKSDYLDIYGTRDRKLGDETETGKDFEGCSINQLHNVCGLQNHFVYARTIDSKCYPARKDVEDRVRVRIESNKRLILSTPKLYSICKFILDEEIEVGKLVKQQIQDVIKFIEQGKAT